MARRKLAKPRLTQGSSIEEADIEPLAPGWDETRLQPSLELQRQVERGAAGSERPKSFNQYHRSQIRIFEELSPAKEREASKKLAESRASAGLPAKSVKLTQAHEWLRDIPPIHGLAPIPLMILVRISGNHARAHMSVGKSIVAEIVHRRKMLMQSKGFEEKEDAHEDGYRTLDPAHESAWNDLRAHIIKVNKKQEKILTPPPVAGNVPSVGSAG